MSASRRRLPPWILPVATLAFVFSCRSDSLAISPRVESLARSYTAGVRLGSMMVEERKVGLRFVGDSFALSEIFVSLPWQAQLLEALGGELRQRAGRVEAVVLTALPGEAVQRVRKQLQRVLRLPPREGCGGFPGVAMDQVLHWEVGESGGAALTLPRFRVPGSQSLAQLVFFAGRWHGDRFVYDYQPVPCPKFSGGERPEDHP